MSRKTRNWILVLVLVPAAVYGAAKLAVWYSVKDALDDARQSLSPVASLEHSKILSPVFGSFGVTGLIIQPHILEQGIEVGSALVNIKDPIEKYHFFRSTMNDTLPTDFNFSLSRIRVPLGGDIGSWLDQQVASTGTAAGTSEGCRAGNVFSVSDMRSMGYQELVGNIVLDYSYDRRSGGLVTYLDMTFDEMFQITVEGKVPSSEVVLSVDRINSFPKLSDLSISISDASWASRFNRYCANTLGITETEYVQQRVSDLRQMMVDAGFEPSAELLAALKQFFSGSAPVTLSLNPRNLLEPANLRIDDDPETVIDQLGIEVIVDGKPVQNLGAPRQPIAEAEEAEQQQIDETFKPTPVRELTLYLSNRARIFTEDGKVHEGYLERIDAGKIVITRHLVGGSVTFDVARGEVKEVQVLRP